MPGDEASVCLHLDDASAIERMAATEELSVSMIVDGARYAFASHPLSAVDAGPGTLVLAAPRELFVLERRRAVRRRLRQGLGVRLEPRRTDAEPTEDALTAVILNLSPDGLACRLSTTRTTQLSVADRLLVSFSLAPDNQTFAFIGHIVSITEGGTPGQVVLGIEFLRGDTPYAQEALRAALAADNDA